MTSLEGNLFIDKTEMANIDYREYLYWMARVHGRQSEIYQAALPDTSVWQSIEGWHFQKEYFRNPRYEICPVVGLSYEQVVNYTNWRTSRVAEEILIDEGYKLPDSSLDNHFSWDSFIAGKEKDQLLKSGSLLFPVYSLPSQQILEQIASAIHLEGEDDQLKNGPFVLIDSPGELDGHNLVQLPAANRLYQGGQQIIHLIGNVAEITAQEGIAVGGSWQHTSEESLPGQIQTYEAPHNWLGFRCVAKWVRVEF